MAQPVLNPVELPADLFPAEVEFARCLARGIPCTVGNGELPKEEIESGDNANVVRGEVIRFFACGGDPDKHPIRESVIVLQGAWIPKESSLSLTHATISRALLFHNCHFACSVEMLHAECVALYLDGSRLAQGLNASGLTTRGEVNLRNGFSAESEVGLSGANIGGGLDCGGGKFHNPNGDALTADGMTTKGGVNLRNGFFAEGEVRLPGANVGGNLSCEDGRFHNPEGCALNADGITVKGDVVLCDGFSAEGEVRLPDANVGRLSCKGGRFHNLEGCALNAEGVIVHSLFIWIETSGGGIVALVHAKVGIFADDADSWKPFDVVLDGFTYNSFAGPVDAQSRLDWLGNRPQGMRFSPLPYEQAAKVLFGMGHANDAREILLEKERLQTKDERTPWHHKIGRRLWDVFAGYGYRLRKTAAWMAGFVLVGAFLFNFADDNGRMVPHQPVVLANAEYREATNSPCAEFKCPPEKRPTELVKRLFPDYPEFNALVYSADVFIPFFALHQEPYWYSKPREMDGWFFRWFMPFWYWLEIGAGWVLTSLFLLSITGLLRPRQSSGEKG